MYIFTSNGTIHELGKEWWALQGGTEKNRPGEFPAGGIEQKTVQVTS